MPVVMEKRIVFTLDEVKAIIIQCQHCRARIPIRDFKIGDSTRSRAFHSNVCPHCGDPWKPDNQADSKDFEAAHNLINALGYFTDAAFKERLKRDVDKRPREKEVKRTFYLELPGDPD